RAGAARRRPHPRRRGERVHPAGGGAVGSTRLFALALLVAQLVVEQRPAADVDATRTTHTHAAHGAHATHAIVVGANRGLAHERPLRFATTDAEHLADTLVAVGAVAPERLLLMLQPDPDEIQEALARLQQRLGSGDTFLF